MIVTQETPISTLYSLDVIHYKQYLHNALDHYGIKSATQARPFQIIHTSIYADI